MGSAWSGRKADQVKSTLHSSAHEERSKLLEIARQQRMNTDVRKNIFCTIMSSEVSVINLGFIVKCLYGEQRLKL